MTLSLVTGTIRALLEALCKSLSRTGAAPATTIFLVCAQSGSIRTDKNRTERRIEYLLCESDSIAVGLTSDSGRNTTFDGLNVLRKSRIIAMPVFIGWRRGGAPMNSRTFCMFAVACRGVSQAGLAATYYA